MKKLLLLIVFIGIILGLLHFSGTVNLLELAGIAPDKTETNTTAENISKKSETTPSEVTTPPAPEKKLARGIDIAKFQGDEIDFLNKRADDLSFVICKATEGVTYTDPDFSRNWKTIPEKGFIRGAYHFFRSKDNPIQQAENYLNAIHDLDNGDLPPIVDFEGAGIDKFQPIEEVQKSLLHFLERLEQEWDRVPIIYVDKSTGDRYLDDPYFSRYPLWIASYEAGTSPPLPSAWVDSKWTFWQKSSSYKVDGRKNDLDCFNGDVKELLGFISGD